MTFASCMKSNFLILAPINSNPNKMNDSLFKAVYNSISTRH